MPCLSLRGRAALAMLCAFAAPACAVTDHAGTIERAQDSDMIDEPAAVAHASVDRDHAAACVGYCEAFARVCDRPLAYPDLRDCLSTCDGWSLGEAGELGPSVACHAAMVPGTGDAFGSCIAAGPDSPVCADV
jgi:hypothetical protein